MEVNSHLFDIINRTFGGGGGEDRRGGGEELCFPCLCFFFYLMFSVSYIIYYLVVVERLIKSKMSFKYDIFNQINQIVSD